VTGPLEISNFEFLLRTAGYRKLYELNYGQRSLSICLRDSPKSNERSSPSRIGDAGYCSRSGTFQGKLYDLGRYPGVVRSHGNTDRVIGEIYRFSEPQRAFQILDEYEGHRFKRKRVTIIQEDGKSNTSWIYLYARSVTRRALIRSGDYVQYRNSF
jgi:gamma-glutamylcyclotransferase (GGCT)/AIG2-like uncharacterized protein YtfP